MKLGFLAATAATVALSTSAVSTEAVAGDRSRDREAAVAGILGFALGTAVGRATGGNGGGYYGGNPGYYGGGYGSGGDCVIDGVNYSGSQCRQSFNNRGYYNPGAYGNVPAYGGQRTRTCATQYGPVQTTQQCSDRGYYQGYSF